jgi:hypothetical protein
MGRPKAEDVHSLSRLKQSKIVLHCQSLLVSNTFGSIHELEYEFDYLYASRDLLTRRIEGGCIALRVRIPRVGCVGKTIYRT